VPLSDNNVSEYTVTANYTLRNESFDKFIYDFCTYPRSA
jgi:hypothetical protein